MRRRPESRSQDVGGLVSELVQVGFDLVFRCAPREIRVGLVETDRAEGAHHRRTGESLSQEDDVRVRPLHIGDDLLPEAHGLRVRVVDAEDRDAMRDPDLQDLSDRGIDSRVVSSKEVLFSQ